MIYRAVYNGTQAFEDGHAFKLFQSTGVTAPDGEMVERLIFQCVSRNDSVAENAWKPTAGCPPTPEGSFYLIGQPERNDPTQADTEDNPWVAEGRFFVPITNIPGHDGIGQHGGGTCVTPPAIAALLPRQGWCPTLNCFRFQNADLENYVRLLLLPGVAFPIRFTVLQS